MSVKQKIAGAARKTGLVTAGTFLGAVGAGFLTVAAWIYLATSYDALLAASVIGCAYFGLGLIILAFGLSSGRSSSTEAQQHSPTSTQAETPAQLVALSFLQGLEQGQQARRAMRS